MPKGEFNKVKGPTSTNLFYSFQANVQFLNLLKTSGVIEKEHWPERGQLLQTVYKSFDN